MLYICTVYLIHKFIAFFFLAVLFVGNVGVSVFKHYCDKDGLSISYVVNDTEEQCGKHDEKSCCHSDHSGHSEASFEKTSCCDIEVSYYHLSSDFTEYASVDLDQSNAVLIAENSFGFVPIDLEKVLGEKNYSNPPPLSGREVLLNKQSWLI